MLNWQIPSINISSANLNSFLLTYNLKMRGFAVVWCRDVEIHWHSVAAMLDYANRQRRPWQNGAIYYHSNVCRNKKQTK